MSMATQNSQSTRALSLQQLDAVQTYVTHVTPGRDRSGYQIQRVVEDGYHARVHLDGDTREFRIAFTDRAAQALENRYTGSVVVLDLEEATQS